MLNQSSVDFALGADRSPGHRHHHIPDKARHGEGHFQAPEALAGRGPEASACLVKISRNGPQRLIEAECHVPGLTCEDSKNSGKLWTEHVARKQGDEEEDCKGEVAEDRDRLQHVEDQRSVWHFCSKY